MALTKTPTSILKMNKPTMTSNRNTHSDTPYTKNAAFTVRRSAGFHSPLPPSLMRLPTMSLSGSSSSTLENSFSSLNSSTSSIYDTVSMNLDLDLELNDSKLDEWLARLDRATKSSKEERNTPRYIRKSNSKVSFAASSSEPATKRTISQSSPNLESQQTTTQPATKRRRFARRNSFVVRDLHHLKGL